MAMNKIQDVKLETTATYQPLSDLNVRFWSQDKNTAELRFIITRNKFPLSLSKENVKVIIALESGTSFISSDDFIIDSEVEGVARYIIPTDFMRVASNVTGQVYVTTLDREEVIVERQFKFTVSDDLLSDYPSEDKLRYIKTFDDLRTEISSRVSKLESDMETMEDYVTQVQDTTQEGITALSTLIQQKQDAYNTNHTAKMKELNDKGTEYSTKFDEDKVYMDEKLEAFKESVTGSGLVTQGEAQNWQKYKLTDDSGVLPIVNLRGDLEALQALPSGFHYISFVPITGMGQTSSTGFVTVWESNGGSVKNISFKPYNSTQEFIMRYYNEWTGWENKFDGLEKTVDAQAKANTAENNAKQYTDEKMSTLHEVLFTGSVNGVSKNIMLNDDCNNFDEVRLFYSTLGGRDSKVVKAKETNQIVIHSFNLTNSDGSNGDIFETTIDRVNGTTLKISNEVRFNLLNQTGGSTSGITITEIVGVKY